MARRIKKTDLGKAWARSRVNRSRVPKVEVRRRILILSEDKKSSCYYFRKYAKEFLPGYVSVCVCGMGMSTKSLVSEVARVENEELGRLRDSGVINPHFDEIWVVFDLDDFKEDDFDNAIYMANGMNRCHAAWSNECFEYWYLLHFDKYVSAMKRKTIFDKLETLIPEYQARFPETHYEDLKGESGIRIHEDFAMMADAREKAFQRAQEQDVYWSSGTEPPHGRNPATQVHKLIQALQSSRSIAEKLK